MMDLGRWMTFSAALYALAVGCNHAPAVKSRPIETMSHWTPSQATHIILFIGDGMHLSHEIAGSRFWTHCERGLIWNSFPAQAFVTTWDINTYNRHALSRGVPAFSRARQIDPYVGYDPALGGAEPVAYFDRGPVARVRDAYFLSPIPEVEKGAAVVPATDSASAATAMATGRKTTSGRVSCAPAPSPCDAASYRTIAELLREEGYAIGIAATVPFSHATPAAFASHAESRGQYRDIAAQMARMDLADVIIGGGHPSVSGEKFVAFSTIGELRGRTREIVFAELAPGRAGDAVLHEKSNEAAAAGKKLFGLFGTGLDGSFVHKERGANGCSMRRTSEDDPTLAGVVQAALRVLAARQDSFFLMAEQGDIDWANHQNDYDWMVAAVGSLNDAVTATVAFVDEPGDAIDWQNTLLLVTSDHGNGYMRLLPEDTPDHCLPRRVESKAPDAICVERGALYDAAQVTYGLCQSTYSHTNELVSLFGKGAAADFRTGTQGLYGEAPALLDNTQLFKIMCTAAHLRAKDCAAANWIFPQRQRRRRKRREGPPKSSARVLAPRVGGIDDHAEADHLEVEAHSDLVIRR
jgi:alkaline phosphatase